MFLGRGEKAHQALRNPLVLSDPFYLSLLFSHPHILTKAKEEVNIYALIAFTEAVRCLVCFHLGASLLGIVDSLQVGLGGTCLHTTEISSLGEMGSF